MTAEMAMNIGRATAHIFKRKGHHPRIIIGKDTRISGYMIEYALVSGITSMGVDALLVGPLPTPGIAFLTTSMRADAGIVISASHNPFQDNGIKIFSGEGLKLTDDQENQIEELIFENRMISLRQNPSELGKAYRIDDARGRYIVFLKYTFPREYSLEGMKIVIDCANGATYRIAPETFVELGAHVKSLFVNPDGKNINLNCGSQHPETLAEEVVKTKADIGLAFDGDGDRLIAVDETGHILTGDQILVICARMMKKEGRLKNNLAITTIMSNLGLRIALKKMGIDHIMTQVGDRYVLEEMQARGANIGGEDSGHMIFLDHHTTGDGIITALQLISAMKKEGKPLSELVKVMKVYPQVLINVEVKDKPDLSKIPEINQIIKKAEEELRHMGRVLVRYSGTQPICRVMVEGPTPEVTRRYCHMIADIVREKLS